MSGKLHLTEIGRVAVPGVDVDAEIARWGHPVPPMFRLRDPGGNSLTIVEPVEWISQPRSANAQPMEETPWRR